MTENARTVETQRHEALPRAVWRDARRFVPGEAEGRALVSAGRSVPLDADVVHLGRGISATLCFDDPSVSRRHATLVHDGSVTRIHDDCSSNGTWVNGERVEAAVLQDGDVIALGLLVLVYRDAAADVPVAV